MNQKIPISVGQQGQVYVKGAETAGGGNYQFSSHLFPTHSLPVKNPSGNFQSPMKNISGHFQPNVKLLRL